MAMTIDERKEFDTIISQFKDLVPNLKIRQQPAASLKKLLEFENQFQINTVFVINEDTIIGDTKIKKEILQEWIDTFRIFDMHNGNMSKINHIDFKKSNRHYINGNSPKSKKDKFNKKEPYPYGSGSFLLNLFFRMH